MPAKPQGTWRKGRGSLNDWVVHRAQFPESLPPVFTGPSFFI